MQISDDVFSLFPDYCRGVVFVTGLENPLAPEALTRELRMEEEQVREKYAGMDLNDIPKLAAWRDAFRKTGIKPTKYRPSIDGLARRVIQGNPLPAINSLVDIGNLFSLRFMVPVGGHATDVLEDGMALRLADGSETFTAFGSDVVEHPEKGEIIFVDGNTVMTRRWVWRQAGHTLVQANTKAVEINVDGLPPVSHNEVEQICSLLSDTVVKYCGGRAFYEVLTSNRTSMKLG
jgi:DNA/RNA-binding domain of Phe-tRNA-synthetase-like protein